MFHKSSHSIFKTFPASVNLSRIPKNLTQIFEQQICPVELYCKEQKGIDLVITDLIMPEKEGIETIMELKREFPEVKIIAISGGGRIGPEEYLSLAGAIGAQHTFSKPFETRDLLEAIRNLVGGDNKSL